MGDSPQEERDGTIGTAVGTLYVIHGTFLAAVVIYFVLTLVVKARGAERALPVEGVPLAAIFGVASLVCMICGFAVGWFKNPAEGVTSRQERSRRVTTQLIVADALFEAPAVLGLVLFLLGFPLKQAHLLIFASLLVVALQTLHLGRYAEAIQRRGTGPNYRGNGAV
ncbi:MAG: hypothetical protein V2A74_03635 [bacterium]